MPSSEQQDEFRNNCTYTWTTVNGVNGWQFTGLTAAASSCLGGH